MIAMRILIALIALCGALPGRAAEAPASAVGKDKAQPVDCRTASLTAVLGDLPRELVKPIYPQTKVLPVDGEGSLVLSGPLNIPEGKAPEFRLFMAPKVVPWSAPSDAFHERRSISASRVESGPRSGSYKIGFIPSEREYDSWVNPRQSRSVFVLACDGERLVAWSATGAPFASRRSANVWAGIATTLVFVVSGTVVYFLRRKEIKEEDDKQKIYRLAEIKKWPAWRIIDPVAITSDMFDRGSLSKLQILFFVLVITYAVTFTAFWRGELTELSLSLFYLLGIPSMGTIASHFAMTKTDRFSAENWAWLVSRKILPLNDMGRGPGPKLTDLFMSDSELDLYKLQSMTFSIIVGTSLIISGPDGLSDFEIPSTLLAILGLSQVVLVGGRVARPTTFGDIDKLVTELRMRETVLRRASSTGVDVDENGAWLGVDASPPAKRPKTLKEASELVPTAAKRFKDVALEVRVLLAAIAHRSVDEKRLLSPDLD